MIKLKNYSKLNAPRVVTLRIYKFRFIQVLIKILLEYFIFFLFRYLFVYKDRNYNDARVQLIYCK